MALELPKLSLGWDVWPWIERTLGIELTEEQVVRLFAYYRVDEAGRRLVRRAAVRRPKGIGKSPEGGYVGFAELAGPVRFSGVWDVDGRPIGAAHPRPLVQIAAVSEDQTDNVMDWLFDTVVERKDTIEELGLDVGRSQITRRKRNGEGRPGKLEVITSEAVSKEGGRGTFAVLDQSEAWTSGNGGVRLAGVLRRNAAKVGGWTLELQNAPEPGDMSVADRTARAAAKDPVGVFFDGGPEVPEVPDLNDRPALLAALRVAYGAAATERGGWVDLERIADDCVDPDTDPSDARRYYLNTETPAGERAFDRVRFVELGAGIRPAKGELVVVGFDGSKFDDATALVATGVESGVQWLAGLWEKPERDGDDWEVPDAEVDAVVEELFDVWDVWRLYADPFRWRGAMTRWSGYGEDRVASWSTARWRQIGYACRNFAAELRSGELTNDSGSDDVHGADFVRHVGNAVRRYVNARDEKNARLWTIAKPKPVLKIDAAMAAVLSAEARRDALAAGALSKRRRRRAAGF